MTTPTFDRFSNEILTDYQQGKYQEALNVIDKALEHFPQRAQLLVYWKMCMYGKLNDVDSTIQAFQNAIDAGYWYGPSQLADDDADLLPATGHAEFRRLRDLSIERHQEAVKNAKPELLVLPPCADTNPPYPMLLVLHGNNSNAEDTAQFWKSLTEQGWLVALAQSSQISGPFAYIWNDASIAVPEIQTHFAQLQKDYPLDESRIVVGGFSAGAGLACGLVLRQEIKAKGFVALGPFFQSAEDFASEIDFSAVKHVQGVMIVGDQDQPCLVGTLKMTAILKENQVPCHLTLIEDLGHIYPQDFDQRLSKAISYILNS